MNEINDVMNFIESMKDVTDDLFEDQGKTTQDAKGITPPRATKARDITEISFNRNAIKRSHDSIVHNGPRVHPSRSHMITTEDLNQSSNYAVVENTFSGMTAQSAYVQATSSYYIDKNGLYIDKDVEPLSSRVDDHPFSPFGRSLATYNVTRDKFSASINIDATNIRPTGTNKNKGKCKNAKKQTSGASSRPKTKKLKNSIPIGEQCRRTPCKDRGTNINHRHIECRFKHKDQ